MRAASREALTAVRKQLMGVTEAEFAPGSAATSSGFGTAEWEQLAAELRDVSDLLVSTPRVRRALADPARSTQQRCELLSVLLGGRVTAVTLRVLDTVVRRRWSSAVDLLGAVELLAVDAELESVAVIGSSTGDSGERTDANLAEVEDELFRFHQIVNAHPDLLRVLSNVALPVAERTVLTAQLLQDKAKPTTVRLAVVALHGLGGRSFTGGLLELVELVAARRESQVAYVRSATVLTAQQETRLVRHLSETYGRQVSLQVDLDPTVVGGVVVEVGDDRYDGSVARLLEQARTAMA